MKKSVSVLSNLVIDEISLCDFPANPHARVVIAKRAGDTYITKRLARKMEKATLRRVRKARIEEKQSMSKIERLEKRLEQKKARREAKLRKRASEVLQVAAGEAAAQSPGALGAQLISDAKAAFPGKSQAAAVDAFLLANKDRYREYVDATIA